MKQAHSCTLLPAKPPTSQTQLAVKRVQSAEHYSYICEEGTIKRYEYKFIRTGI